MIIRLCEPRGSSWPAYYRSYVVELFRPMMNIVVALAMMRVAVSTGDYAGKSLNDMLKWTMLPNLLAGCPDNILVGERR